MVAVWGFFLGLGPLFMGILALAIHFGAYADAGWLLLSIAVVWGLRLAGMAIADSVVDKT